MTDTLPVSCTWELPSPATPDPAGSLISVGAEKVPFHSSFGEDHSDFVWTSHILAGVSLDFQDTMEGEVGNRRIIKINKVLKTHECAHPSSQSMCRGLVNLSNCLLLPTNAISIHKNIYTVSYTGNISLKFLSTLEVEMCVDGRPGDSLYHVSALDKVIHNLV
ncbi:hypothetical protein DUI87_11578 [Hirundo rustica rustica]|uniref:Uncharacterized protein n=1 Tax=Hirundo rustica rustica TaxID=333673 RepID=A0A3M0KE11_HIRRU|nr:hypothetical protein DUI87_11578 [Hirundo rustica rustica]